MIFKNNNLYIYFHIPKTAGSSFKFHLFRNFNKREVLYLYKDNPNFKNEISIKQYLTSLSISEKNKIKIIIGHEVFYGIHEFFNRPCRYITFLRHPASRTISHYSYFIDQAKAGRLESHSEINSTRSFYAFIQDHNYHNYMFKSLLSRKFANGEDLKNFGLKVCIKNILNKFYFIGITEKSQQDFAYLNNLLGINQVMLKINPSKSQVNLTPEVIKKISKVTAIDEYLHSETVKVNEGYRQTADYQEAVKNLNHIPNLYLLFYQLLGKVLAKTARLRLHLKTFSKFADYLSTKMYH